LANKFAVLGLRLREGVPLDAITLEQVASAARDVGLAQIDLL
jgi:hypothetical protein